MLVDKQVQNVLCLHYPGAHLSHAAVKERKGKVSWVDQA